MRFLASSFGSAGDFLPTLAIARALRVEGHDVVFVTNPFHERAVRRAGLHFVGAGELVDVTGLIVRDPSLLDPSRGMRVLLQEVGPAYVVATYHAARSLLREAPFDAVIGSNLAYGVLWAAMERRVPNVMVSATPLFWASAAAPVQFLDFEIPSALLPYAVGLTSTLSTSLLNHGLRSLARAHGVSALDPSLTGIEAQLALHVGTWPALLQDRAPGDPACRVACGFASAGRLGASAPGLPGALESFLEDGDAPIVIGLGSIFSLGSDDLVADLAAASADLGKRSVVVGPPPRDRELPEGCFVVPYAPYDLLFPRAAAVVVHGGAGSTGEALRCGRPSVIVPLALDQFSLAWHVERLGAGVRVAKRGRDRAALTRALERACGDARIAARAAEVAETLRAAPDGATRAAGLLAERTRR